MPASDNSNIKGLRPSLSELIDAKEWQKIQDNFSAVTGIGLRVLNSHCFPVIMPTGIPRLCSELLKGARKAEGVCGKCLPTFLGGKWPADKNLGYTCYSGLYSFIIPLTVEEQVMGYILVGPIVLVARKPKEMYRKVAEDLGLDLEDFWSALCEVKAISFNGAQSLAELIRDVFEYLLKMSYRNLMVRKELLMVDSPKMGRLLKALLDVACQVSGADTGSVMFLDKSRNELSIKASRGLSEDIVINSRVKLGEGVSGLAAKEGEAFIIDDTLRDNRIKNFLNRPHIKSSMVVPLKVEDSVVGVLNLGAVSTAARFDLASLKLMNNLTDLATVALHE
jgi:ligand-binding sensor protein/putative methionine-R-sulfoxide reductase with GAF domain